MIGPGVVGHWIAPGERDVPDPDEYLKVSARSARPLNGLLSFRFLEPMEETVYLDQVRLLAIDHPAAYEVNPNERFVSAPPFPEFRVIASRDARVPNGAWDEQGNSVLPLIAKRDRQYVTNFDSVPFVGFAKLHWLELDLGDWDSSKPLRLIMDGYTDYFTATSMYAADQAGIKVIAPYVEALDAQGNWKRVIDDMGFPAGLERTMVADLSGKIPPGTRRIRIVNNLKIYWDAIRIDQTPETNDVRVAEVPLAGAALEFLGFPLEQRLKPASDTTYSYSRRSKTGPYARAAGNYTRYGDVRELLRASDDRFTVFGSGEGLKLDFDPKNCRRCPRAGYAITFFMRMVSRKTWIFTLPMPSRSSPYRATHFCLIPILPVRIILRTLLTSITNWNLTPASAPIVCRRVCDIRTRQNSDRIPRLKFLFLRHFDPRTLLSAFCDGFADQQFLVSRLKIRKLLRSLKISGLHVFIKIPKQLHESIRIALRVSAWIRCITASLRAHQRRVFGQNSVCFIPPPDP